MTTNQPLSLFISSKMTELAEERRAVQNALKSYNMYGWLFEKDAGARPESIQQTYFEEVAACDIYIGLFWLGYGEYTIEEYEKARSLHKPCLIYERHIDVEQRDPRLTTFLEDMQHVTDPSGLTIRRFQTSTELAGQVNNDVMHLLITDFRKSRRQPPVWNIPYEQNPFFTGREPLLRQLHEMLHRKGSSALSQPQALSGLGGIGKTQTALEYSYRYRHEYHAIFWIRAESEAALNTSYADIAKRLALPKQEAPDPDKIVQAVKQWLEQQEQWLLIFDNADTPTLLKRYVPRNATGKGHVLLTSRVQVFDMLGIARPMEVQEMRPEEAVAFLLKRTGRDEPESQERTAGEQLAKELGYLPLALEQSSAYMLEKHSRFQDYLASYRRQRLALLNKAQPKATDYPESVATTWAINFREVEKEPAAADVLRLSAFLGPDHIPLELLTLGASHLGPVLSEVLARATDDPLVLDETLEPLTRYSLIHRDVDTQTYSLHRLVQEVVKDKMDAATRQLWAERAVRMVKESFPFDEVAPWPLSQRYLLHALECVTHIKQHHMAFFESALLLDSIGVYFWSRGQYEDVEQMFQQAITIFEQVKGPNDLSTVASLNNLALLYYNQGKYEQAEPLYQRVLAIFERMLGAEHPDTADSLNNLAVLYRNQGKDEQAEPLYQRALAIRERVLGAEHPDTAQSLNNLAALYWNQGKDEQAEPLYQRALAISERVLGAEHPDTATSLNNLAILYCNQGKDEQAELLYQRALAIRERVLGAEHPDTKRVRENYTDLLQKMNRE